jgi:type I restriction enzyme, S subunit
MNAAQVLDHFDRISGAPDASPRLRRFILDLAVRGKLVKQYPNDEPASELLKRIQAEKVRLVKDGKIGKPSLLKDDAEAEHPFLVPETWEWTPATYPTFLISDLGKKIQTKDVLQAGKFPVVDQGKIFIRGYCNDSDKVIHVEEPVIIFGDHTRETKLVNFDFVVGAEGVKILKPIQIVPAYYFQTLQWLPLDSRGYGRHFKLLRAMKIPLPPLAEQHRIVAKVDELMALCDRLEAAQTERESRRDRVAAASLHRLNNASDADTFREHARFHLHHLPRFTTRVEHIQQLRQTILNLAVRGKLVPQDPNDEPASELIKKIQAMKEDLVREGEIGRTKPLLPAEADELEFELKPGWSAARISQILLKLQTGPFGSSLHKSDYQLGGVPVINPASIKNDRLVPIDGVAVGATTLKRLGTFRLRAGDIVMGRRGEMGRSAVVSEEEDGWLCGTGCLILRLPECLCPRFLVTVIGSPFVRKYLGGSAVGITMQNLNQFILLNLVIGIPPLAEQHRIVAKVDEVMTLCDRLEAQIATTQTESRLLLESMLHAAVEEGKISVSKLSGKVEATIAGRL